MSDRRQVVKDLAQLVIGHIKSTLTAGTQDEFSRYGLQAVTKLREFAQENLTDWRKSTQNIAAQVLPDGTRFAKCGGPYVALAIEQKPSIRTLNIDSRLLSTLSTSDGERAGRPKEKVQLSLPYVVFVPRLRVYEGTKYYSHESLRVYLRSSPLRSAKDELGSTILPNMSSVVCLGGSFPGASGTLIEVCEKVIAYYWGSGFTMDYTEAWTHIARTHPQLKNLQSWADATGTDPDFILGVKWQDALKLDELFSLLCDMTEIEPPDISFIQGLTESLESEISKVLEQAGKLDASTLDRFTAALSQSLDGTGAVEQPRRSETSAQTGPQGLTTADLAKAGR